MFRDFTIPLTTSNSPSNTNGGAIVSFVGGTIEVRISDDSLNGLQGTDRFIVIAKKVVQLAMSELSSSDFTSENIISMIPAESLQNLDRLSGSGFQNYIHFWQIYYTTSVSTAELVDIHA